MRPVRPEPPNRADPNPQIQFITQNDVCTRYCIWRLLGVAGDCCRVHQLLEIAGGFPEGSFGLRRLDGMAREYLPCAHSVGRCSLCMPQRDSVVNLHPKVLLPQCS